MAGEKIYKKLELLFILTLPLLAAACASQIPPGGGAIDTTPPKILEVYPSNAATNFNDDHIEIVFSEYVDKLSVQNALFISPALEGSPEYDWSGKTLRVNFPGALKKNITYNVTIGTDAVDINNRNKMAQAYSFSFATGSVIDKGSVQGKIYTDNPSGIMLYAYPDSGKVINPTVQKPKYLSIAGTNGEFKIAGMAWDNYRIFAIKDEYKDFLYHVGENLYGAPFTIVTLSEKDTVFHGLNFRLTQEDTVKPRMVSTVMTDRFHILISFSEPIDSTLLSRNNFSIYDSSSRKSIQPLYVFQGRAKKNEAVISLTDTVKDADNVFLNAVKLTDKSGNTTLSDHSRITASSKPDTTAPKLILSRPEKNNSIEPDHPVFMFGFDDGFDSLRAARTIAVKDKTGTLIPSKIHFLDDSSFRVSVLAQLKPRQNYALSIDLKNIVDAAGNKTDSVFTYKFITTSGQEYTGISGYVKNDNASEKNLFVILQGIENEKQVYKNRVNNKLQFNFDKVEAGKYILWSFVDKDSSGSFSFGKPFPFKESDRFAVYPDTLNLRARWPVADITIQYK